MGAWLQVFTFFTSDNVCQYIEPCSVLREVFVAVVTVFAVIVLALGIALVVAVLTLRRHRHSQPLDGTQFDPTSLRSGGDMHHPEDHGESSSHVVTPDNLTSENIA